MSASDNYNEYMREQWLQDIGKNPDDGFSDLEPLDPPEPIMVYCCEKCHRLEPAGQRTDDFIDCEDCEPGHYSGTMWLMNEADL